MSGNHQYHGVLAVALWCCILFLAVLVVDVLFTLWPWPHGPRGPAVLHTIILRESALADALADDASRQVIRTTYEWLYRAVFVWTGLDELIRGAQDPATLAGMDRFMRAFVISNWDFLTTALYGLRLFAMRLGVLILATPLFVTTAIGTAADGLVTWYLRRSGAGRESGFIYHRAKRGLWLLFIALWVIYLIPPAVMDPRLIVAPTLLLFGLLVRTGVAWFKKYL